MQTETSSKIQTSVVWIAGGGALLVAALVISQSAMNAMFIDELIQLIKLDPNQAKPLTLFEALFLAPLSTIPLEHLFLSSLQLRYLCTASFATVGLYLLFRAIRAREYAAILAILVWLATGWLSAVAAVARPTIFAMLGTALYATDKKKSWQTALGLLLCLANPFAIAMFVIAQFADSGWRSWFWVGLAMIVGPINAFPVLSQYFGEGTRFMSPLYVQLLAEMRDLPLLSYFLITTIHPFVLPSTLLLLWLLATTKDPRRILTYRSRAVGFLLVPLVLIGANKFVIFRYIFPLYIWTFLTLIPVRWEQDKERTAKLLALYVIANACLSSYYLPQGVHWESPSLGQLKEPIELPQPENGCTVVLDADTATNLMISMDVALAQGLWGSMSHGYYYHCTVQFSERWNRLMFENTQQGLAFNMFNTPNQMRCVPSATINTTTRDGVVFEGWHRPAQCIE